MICQQRNSLPCFILFYLFTSLWLLNQTFSLPAVAEAQGGSWAAQGFCLQTFLNSHTPCTTNMIFSGETSHLSILKERVGICWGCSIPEILNHPLDVCSWRPSLLYPWGEGYNNIIPVVFLLDPSSLLAAFLGTGLNAVGDLVKAPSSLWKAGQKSPWAQWNASPAIPQIVSTAVNPLRWTRSRTRLLTK